MTQIFAHRGSSGTEPENTMAAFEEAARVGAGGIEFDVQMTKDKELVVLHDERVDRTTDGKGWVNQYTLKELKTLNAGVKKKRVERIPTLSEVLDWSRSNRMLLNIELKTEVIQYPNIEKRTIEAVRHFGLTDRVIVSSFNHYSVEKVHEIDPNVDTAILFMEGLFEPWKYAKSIGASGLHYYWKVASPEFIEGAKEAGMAVRPFTVNRKPLIRKFIMAGCTGLFTDFPERALQVRKKCLD
ncbi:MAG TPA: glycerophosphodiester phosphodiesterase [Bacillales bacterium]|nr:glycerophosphodiester phosphodiesterase [Bacillales bacterium]